MNADATLRKLTEQMYESINSFLFELNNEQTRTAITSMLQAQIQNIAQRYSLNVDTDQIGLEQCADPRVLEVNDYTATFMKLLNELIKEEDRLATKALLKNL